MRNATTRGRRPLGTIAIAALALAVAGCNNQAASSTADERAACANLYRLDPCSTASADETACVEDLVALRPDGTCDAEWDAFVRCLQALRECPTDASVLCPSEYSALGACVRVMP